MFHIIINSFSYIYDFQFLVKCLKRVILFSIHIDHNELIYAPPSYVALSLHRYQSYLMLFLFINKNKFDLF